MKASKKDQKESRNPSELSFWGFKKTKESQTRGQLSFWRVQKDKRELESGRTVLLDASKRQKRARPGANCPFEGFKKTKGSWNPVELSFWMPQKDKREPDPVKSRLLCKFMGKCFQPPLHFFGLTSMDFFLHLREGMSNAFQFDIPS
ncbi:hypothetical protein ABES76_08760, partial [Heyndrickxia faecalis]